MKKVSIIIPVYNRADLIGETIASALGQNYENLEVIVSDNQSTDGTFELLEKYAAEDRRIKLFRNRSNLGPVKNWQRGIHEARGEYAKILWSDDLIAPEFINKCLNLFDSHDDLAFVFSGVVLFGENFRQQAHFGKTRTSGIYDSSAYIASTLLGENFLYSPGCALFRTESLRKNLLLDVPNRIGSDFSSHAIGNDLLIFLLTAVDYPRVGYIEEPLSFFRSHKDSITVSSDAIKLRTMYFLAMAYFVENHITDRVLIKKFNAILTTYLKRIREGHNGISTLEDFYLNEFNLSVDWGFFLKMKFQKKIKKIKKTFSSNIPSVP
jgi:glycosyltransferase involved in cell wall biosynthesis